MWESGFPTWIKFCAQLVSSLRPRLFVLPLWYCLYLEDWPNAWHVYLNWPALGSAGGRRPKCRFWSDNLSGLSEREYFYSHMRVEHGSKACRNNVWFCSWKIFSDDHSRSSAVSAGPDTLPNALRWDALGEVYLDSPVATNKAQGKILRPTQM